MKQSLNAMEFRYGQVDGRWRFSSMTTMRSSTPDALDGRAIASATCYVILLFTAEIRSGHSFSIVCLLNHYP